MNQFRSCLKIALTTFALPVSVAAAQQPSNGDRVQAVLEAVRFLKQSSAAADWSPDFQNAIARDVFFFHAFREGSGSIIAELKATALSGARVTLQEEGWPCLVQRGRERAAVRPVGSRVLPGGGQSGGERRHHNR
jgi:hypothetical protein